MIERILPQLLTYLTGKRREKVIAGLDFEWSRRSWTHDVFRIFELIFWRRAGIRAEGYADNKGNFYSYTWENYIAVAESMMRAALKRKLPRFSIVRISQLQLAGMARDGISPFRFAIAFQNFNSAGFAGVTTQSFALTVSGSNTLVLGAARSAAGSDSITGMTYNAVSLTNGTSVVTPGGGRGTCMKYLKGAATGSNTLAATSSVSGFLLLATSYSGASQSGGMDASTTNTTAGATTLTTSLTTVADNCWVFLFGSFDGSAPIAGTGSTQRVTVNTDTIFDSNAPVTPAGSYSMTFTAGASTPGAANMMSFAPVGGTPFTKTLTETVTDTATLT